jgi:hypothetical protein
MLAKSIETVGNVSAKCLFTACRSRCVRRAKYRIPCVRLIARATQECVNSGRMVNIRDNFRSKLHCINPDDKDCKFYLCLQSHTIV